jgi:regulator of protease activity HflC (stomatin/prohibitin superfamily)
MPETLIFAIVLAVIAVVCAGARVPVKRVVTVSAERTSAVRRPYDDDPVPAPAILLGAAVFFAVFAAVMVLVSSFNPVGTRDIGVVTSFGRLAGHLGPGINFTAPWDYVTSIDDSYQVTDDTFTVRIAGGQTAQATVQLRWDANAAAADDIFRNYKTTAGLEAGLLTPELNAATNAVLDGYDPLTPLASGAAAGTPGNPSTTQLGTQIQSALAARTGQDISIATLVLKPLVYDPTVQARINSITNQVAKTDVAKQSELTAQAQAAANKDLEANLADNPLVLVQQCMSGLNDGDITPVAGFSCWPGSNSGIVIPSASSTTAASK